MVLGTHQLQIQTILNHLKFNIVEQIVSWSIHSVKNKIKINLKKFNTKVSKIIENKVDS